MSLFKLKSLWNKTFPHQEFDEKHLAFGNINKQPAIALANFQGTLHVFLISAKSTLQVKTIYQNNFENPIIAVQFVTHPDDKVRSKAVGVLFFRKFTFVTLQSNGRDNYEAKLMNIEIEPSFGIGVSPLSVMTLNSTVQTLNPRQIHKIKAADPIYPFAQLLSKLYFMDGQQLVQIDGSTQQWRIIVGRARQLFAFVDTVIVIGEKAIWEVSQAKIIKTKVVDEQISCGAIAFLNNNSYNLLIANFSSQLFVYSSNYELLWALKLDYVSLKIVVCQQQQIKGMLVILSEEGGLEIGYSGVEMPQHVVQPLSEKIDFETVQSQTRQLLARGNDKGENQSKKIQKVKEQTKYKLSFGQLQKSYENLQQKNRLFQLEGKLVKFQFICEIASRQNLRNFKVQVNIPTNIVCLQEMKQLKVAKNKDKIIFNLYASNELYPYQREMNVVIRYQNNEQSGIPYIGNQVVSIPIGLQCLINGFETKQAYDNKIIIKSNLELPSFNNLFPQLFTQASGQQRKSVKFILANGVQCIIGYNKGFNKAKIQSPYYSGLCYIISEFANRIRAYNKKTNSKIELSVQIPLEQFFAILKQHYENRQLLKKAFKEVEIKSQQFRNTQKKLLIRMKQKMSNLGNIDKLLEFTYQRLIDSATNYEKVNHEMDIVNHNLSVAITLVIELLFIRSNPSKKAKEIALGILGYQEQSLQRGWEDKVIANSAHFLNKKYKKGDQISFQQLQKIPLYVISKVNNGDWN